MGVDDQIRRMTLEELEEAGCLAHHDRVALEAWHPSGQPLPQQLQTALVEAMAQTRHRLTQPRLH